MAGPRYKATMMEAKHYSPDIEVREQALSEQDMGLISGMFEALANHTMTEADFRGAMELLLAEAGNTRTSGHDVRGACLKVV
jgi:hypothetical protein